jgi:hypothetical protein
LDRFKGVRFFNSADRVRTGGAHAGTTLDHEIP